MEEFLSQAVQNYGFFALIASFFIGVLTSLAPCSIITLPLLVGSAITLSTELDHTSKKVFIYKYSSLFVLGLIISFSTLMLLVSKIGVMLSVAPYWAYILASIATFMIIAYSLGWIDGFDKHEITKRLIKLKLFGAILIELIFGLISTPCATAPLVSIVMASEQSGWIYSYFLVLSFAIGHGILLLFAGISIGFAQNIASNRIINKISNYVNGFFIAVLVIIGFYLLFRAYQIY